MRSYTKEAIRDKFGRIKTRLDKDTQLLNEMGITLDDKTKKAFLIGRLNTLAFDMVACLEARTITSKERKEIIDELLQ